MVISSVQCVIKGHKKRNLHWTLLLFWIHSIISFIDSIISRIFFGSKENTTFFDSYSSSIQFAFIIFEIFAIICFYQNLIWKKKVKYNLIISGLSIFMLLIISNYTNIKYLKNILIFEIIIINIFSAVIFIKQIKESNFIIRDNENSINIGLFLFINLTTPYYVATFTDAYNISTATTISNIINSVGYAIFFMKLKKSFE